MEPSIIAENLTKTFHLKRHVSISKKLGSSKNRNLLIALDNISFSVQQGEMLGIIGENGSGKTTLLRIISGIFHPDNGRVQVNGKLAPLLHIGTGFQNELVAEENIILSGMLNGMSKSEIKEKVPEIVQFAELEDFSDMKLKNYSTGMRARLAFSTALQLEPEILLVDEILSVGDFAFRQKSYKAFMQFKKSGKTILYSTHNLPSVPKLCNRVLLLHHGKLVMIGKAEETIEKYREIIKTRQ